MKMLLGVAAALAVVAAIWFFGFSYSIDVGVSASAPLGDFAKITKELTGKGLRASTPSPDEVKSLFRGRFEVTDDLVASAYVDQVPGLKHQVIVLKRPDGKVAAVLSHFRSGSFSYSETGTAAENFAALYWKLLSGSTPRFEKKNEGGGDAREYTLATFTKGSVEGAWRKEGGGATMNVPQEIADIASFVAK
jgi:hypothetical protein